MNLLRYEKDTGNWFWRESRGRITRGDRAGSLKNGYIYICINTIRYKASRLAFLYMKNYVPKNHIRHKNKINSDDRWDNLIENTRSECQRYRKVSKKNKIGVSGVREKKTYEATVSEKGKKIYLGKYTKINDAVKARWEGEKKYKYPNCNSTSSSYLYLKNNKII